MTCFERMEVNIVMTYGLFLRYDSKHCHTFKKSHIATLKNLRKNNDTTGKKTANKNESNDFRNNIVEAK